VRRGCLAVFSFGVVAIAFAAPTTAHAQLSGVEVGWRRMLEADFDGALGAFDEAERGTLTRGELIRSLEGRAHVHFALGAEEALRAALARLAAIAPEHRLAPESPPELHARFLDHAGRGGITVVVSHEEHGGEARLEARAEGDPGGLVRHVVVAARIDRAAWIEAEDEPLTIPVQPSQTLAWYGQAIGPGGAVVANDGSREAPRVRASPSAALEEDETPWLFIGLAAGGVLIIATVITLVVVLATPPSTQPSPPMFP